MPITVTVYSAAHAMARFWEEHGREPLLTECSKKNNLPHYTTLCRIFHSYSAAISAMYVVVCSANSSAFIRLDNGVTIKPPYKRCLGCGRQIKNVGAHVRHCRFCRQKMFNEEPNSYHDSYPVPRQWYILSRDTDDMEDFDI